MTQKINLKESDVAAMNLFNACRDKLRKTQSEFAEFLGIRFHQCICYQYGRTFIPDKIQKTVDSIMSRPAIYVEFDATNHFSFCCQCGHLMSISNLCTERVAVSGGFEKVSSFLLECPRCGPVSKKTYWGKKARKS